MARKPFRNRFSCNRSTEAALRRCYPERVKVSETRTRFAQVDERFDRIDREFVEVRSEIARESETTRRHFDVVAE
jgi:hypothetical protein